MKEFDNIFYGRLKELGQSNIIYTRYADDITVSYKDVNEHNFKDRAYEISEIVKILFTLTSWNFLPPSAIIKLRKAFLCVVCEQGRKKLCAGGNCSDIFQ